MKPTKRKNWSIVLTVLIVLIFAAQGAMAAEPDAKAAGPDTKATIPSSGFFVDGVEATDFLKNHAVLNCKGTVQLVLDAADETLHATPAIFGTGPGGGQGGQFDPTPVLSIRGVGLDDGECLNAHLTAIIGSAQTYGVAPLALFQVTLTDPATGVGPIHMVGHYPTPYGIPSPAVALEAETDVDMLGANFFQKVGNGPHELPPGNYTVDVWWAGAPPGVPGGALGAAFVLKLYLRD